MAESRSSRLLLFTIGLSALVAACGHQNEGTTPPAGEETGVASPQRPPTSDPSTLPEAGTSRSLALYPYSGTGDQALLRGVLREEGPCLYLVDAEGQRHLLALPSPGTRRLEPGDGIEVRGRTLALGENVTVVGGELKAGAGTIDWIEPPPNECEDSLIWVVNDVSETGGCRWRMSSTVTGKRRLSPPLPDFLPPLAGGVFR